MFTGLVEALGEATAIEAVHPGVKLTIRSPGYFAPCEIGASVALNGCCLTVIER